MYSISNQYSDFNLISLFRKTYYIFLLIYALQISKYDHQNYEETQNTISNLKSFENCISSALRTIHFRLQALLDSKPLPNKLLTKVLVMRRTRLSNFDTSVVYDVSHSEPMNKIKCCNFLYVIFSIVSIYH